MTTSDALIEIINNLDKPMDYSTALALKIIGDKLCVLDKLKEAFNKTDDGYYIDINVTNNNENNYLLKWLNGEDEPDEIDQIDI